MPSCKQQAGYKPLLFKSRWGIIATVLFIIIPVLLTILMKVFSARLSIFDKALAESVIDRNALTTDGNPLPYNTGVFYYINTYLYGFYVFLAIVTVIIFSITIALDVKHKNLRYGYFLYVLVSVVLFVAINVIVVMILKVVLNRPRPRQTVEFHTNETCLVNYRPIFDPYVGKDPCPYKMYSTPSGHVNTTCQCTIPIPILVFFLYKVIALYTRLNSKKLSIRTATKCVFALVGLIAFSLPAVFIPFMMYGRIVANAHFLTDTLFGFLLSVMVMPVFWVAFPTNLLSNENVWNKSPTEPLLAQELV